MSDLISWAVTVAGGIGAVALFLWRYSAAAARVAIQERELAEAQARAIKASEDAQRRAKLDAMTAAERAKAAEPWTRRP